MARTTGKTSLADLIKGGKLRPGDELVLHRRSAPDIKASLEADGTIKCRGKTFDTPSTAARESLDVGAVDGWLRWRVVRLRGRTLADVRDNK
jgi:hypothetical protein